MPVATRMTRAERTEHNRERVLAAAREVFLARGYHGATVEQIAEAAGFSTGVVYSQFGGKADLFLALLEARIEQRIRDNAAVVASISSGTQLELAAGRDAFTGPLLRKVIDRLAT